MTQIHGETNIWEGAELQKAHGRQRGKLHLLLSQPFSFLQATLVYYS